MCSAAFNSDMERRLPQSRQHCFSTALPMPSAPSCLTSNSHIIFIVGSPFFSFCFKDFVFCLSFVLVFVFVFTSICVQRCRLTASITTPLATTDKQQVILPVCLASFEQMFYDSVAAFVGQWAFEEHGWLRLKSHR